MGTGCSNEPLNREKRVYPDALSLLVDGWPTPLLRLRSECNERREVWAKLEFYNPFSHSVKDRTVWSMVVKAVEPCKKAGLVEEASSGNTGIALTCISNILGVKSRIYLPKPTPRTTEVILRMLGAEVVRTKYETIDRTFWDEVRRHAESLGFVNLNQFENDANPEVHYKYTGREIVEQLKAIGRKPDVLVAGIGTSGHIAGIARRLREEYGGLKVVGVQPTPGSKIPGIKRVETEPTWLEEAGVDVLIDVSWREAVEGVREVAVREGVLIGLSSGAVYKAYKKIRGEDGVYILVFPDDGFKYVEHFERYLSQV